MFSSASVRSRASRHWRSVLLWLCARGVAGQAVLAPSANPVCPDYSQPVSRTYNFSGTTWMLPAVGCWTYGVSDPGSTPGGYNFYFQVRHNGCSTFTSYLPLINSKASAAAAWKAQINLTPAQCPLITPGTPNFFSFVVNSTTTLVVVNSTVWYAYAMREAGYNISALVPVRLAVDILVDHPRAVDKVEEALWVKRPPRPVHKRADAVLERLGHGGRAARRLFRLECHKPPR